MFLSWARFTQKPSVNNSNIYDVFNYDYLYTCKSFNDFPGLVYFTQRNSNWGLLPGLSVSLGRLIQLCVSTVCVYPQIFSTKTIALVIFTASIITLAKCFPVLHLFSFTALSSKLVMQLPSFSENGDTHSHRSHI